MLPNEEHISAIMDHAEAGRAADVARLIARGAVDPKRISLALYLAADNGHVE